MTDKDPLTILIIDDDADDRFFMEQVFKTDSPTTRLYLAESGQQALDRLVLLHPAPDVILLDLNMPGLDGFDVLALLKQSSPHRHIPVIVLTTSEAPADQERAYQLGASGFLTKPTTQQGLRQVAQRIRHDWANYLP